MNEEIPVLLIIFAAVTVVTLLGVLNYRSRLRKARRILDEWGSLKNLALLSAEPRYFRCGPFRFRASKARQVFHVVAKTDSGATGEGFALCGGAVFGLMSNSVKVYWND